jgi:hypothetical protein
MSDDNAPNRTNATESEIVQYLLRDFKVEGSRGQQFLGRFPGAEAWSLQSLVNFGRVCSSLIGIDFVRNYTRTRALVVKWLTDNYEVLEPLAGILTVK